jgi:phenylacetate-CoA ligase
MNRLFDKKESWTNEERKTRQDESLSGMVKLGYKKSARLKSILDKNKINPQNIKTREDLEKLPVTSRDWKIPRYQLIESLLHPDRSMNRIYPKMIIYGRALFLPQALAQET